MSREDIKLHPGKRKKHGGYAYLSRSELPENRAYVERYLTTVRGGLIRDLGPTEKDLTTAQIVLIGRIVTKLGVIRCIEEHIRENSVMRGHDVAPSLRKSYLAYNNSVRLDLVALGINKRQSGEALNLREYAVQEYGDKKEKEDGKP